MVTLWASAAALNIDSTAIAFLGLAGLLVSGALTLGDIAKEGDVLATYIWFAILFTISGELNELGFMGFLGQRLAMRLGGLPPAAAGVVLVVAYVRPALPVRQPDGAPARAVRRVPRGRREARRPGGAARLPAAVRDELLLGEHAPGLEREPALRRERVSLAGRPVPARGADDGVQSRGVTSWWARRGCCSRDAAPRTTEDRMSKRLETGRAPVAVLRRVLAFAPTAPVVAAPASHGSSRRPAKSPPLPSSHRRRPAGAKARRAGRRRLAARVRDRRAAAASSSTSRRSRAGTNQRHMIAYAAVGLRAPKGATKPALGTVKLEADTSSRSTSAWSTSRT